MKKKWYFCEGGYMDEKSYIIARTSQLQNCIADCEQKIKFCLAEIEEKRKWIEGFEREIKGLELLGGKKCIPC